MTDQTINSIDDIFACPLDNLADLPEFKCFPAGAHRCIFTSQSKVINGKPALEVTLKALETLESSDPAGAVTSPNQETSILMFLRKADGSKNELGEGQVKAIAKSLSKRFYGELVQDILAEAQGAEVLVVTKVRVNKTNGQQNTDIVTLSVI